MQMSWHNCFAFENILTVIKMILFLGYNFPVLYIHTSLFILRFTKSLYYCVWIQL